MLLNIAFCGFWNCINSDGKCLSSGVLKTWWNLTVEIHWFWFLAKNYALKFQSWLFSKYSPSEHTLFSFHLQCIESTFSSDKEIYRYASLFQQHKHNIDDESLLIIGCWYLLLLWRFLHVFCVTPRRKKLLGWKYNGEMTSFWWSTRLGPISMVCVSISISCCYESR